MTDQPILRLEEVTKQYPDRNAPAVDGVSLEISRGEIISLLGPNGAGKTTTLEMIVGLRRPTSGTVSTLGLNPVSERDEIRRRVAVQPQHATVFDRQTVRELLRCWASFYPDAHTEDHVIGQLGLQDSAEVKIAKLSGGQRQRVLVGLALVSKPELLVLDEPTTGLDPNARQDLWGTIQQYRAEGGTVLLSTHLMEEAEELSDRVAIMHQGKLEAFDTTEYLITEFAPAVEISATVPAEAEHAEVSRLATDLVTEPHGSGGNRISFRTQSSDAALRALTDIRARQIHIREAGLAGVFRTLTGRDMAPQENPAAAVAPDKDLNDRGKIGAL